jgi:hypothetical protein
MKEQRISKPTPKTDVPYDVANAGDVGSFWETATKHRGVEELSAKCGRSTKAETDRKEQIALRLDADALAWYRSHVTCESISTNAVRNAYRDARLGRASIYC